MKKSILIGLSLISGMLHIPMAQAVNCINNPQFVGINTTVALQGGNITVGQDVPNGTTVFRQYFKPSYRPHVSCESNPTSWTWEAVSKYSVLPKPLAAWNSGMWAGRVYETGVPGIGVVAWYNSIPFPMRRDLNTIKVNTAYEYISDVQFDLSFIKIGTIAPGVIRGQDLPTVIMDFIPNNGSTVRLMKVDFNGTLNVISQTCTTPNPVVQMGKYEIGTTFKAVGSVSDWRDASIRLTNCPRFYGKMDSGQTNYGSDSPTDRGQAGTPQDNTLGVTLKPNTAILDASKAIVALKAESNVATGVGIQLATTVSGASGTPAVFNSEKMFTMINRVSTTYTIPLFARYYQTDAKVTPGPANATLTYTINYY